MNAWLKNVDVITLFTEDLERTKLFYQNVLDLPLRFENHNRGIQLRRHMHQYD
jgi:catechol 2,3-dioxygenase-like lactoylglutathione lyase family enzyme